MTADPMALLPPSRLLWTTPLPICTDVTSWKEWRGSQGSSLCTNDYEGASEHALHPLALKWSAIGWYRSLVCMAFWMTWRWRRGDVTHQHCHPLSRCCHVLSH